MKEIPILFSTDMVRAILDGRKTMTRRIVDPQPDDDGLWNHTTNPMSLESTLEGWNGTIAENGASKQWAARYGQPGDILWVRESAYLHKREKQWFYKATDPLTDSIEYGYRWKPSIHMPKHAARIYLQVEAVRVERLQDITEADAKAEGVEIGYAQQGQNKPDLITYKNYLQDRHVFIFPKASFITLWRSINGPNSWAANPWVWVISFKVLSTTGRPEFLPTLTPTHINT